MSYKLIITGKAEELLDNLIYHLIYRLETIWAVAHLFDSIDVLGVDDITCKVVGILKDISFGD